MHSARWIFCGNPPRNWAPCAGQPGMGLEKPEYRSHKGCGGRRRNKQPGDSLTPGEGSWLRQTWDDQLGAVCAEPFQCEHSKDALWARPTLDRLEKAGFESSFPKLPKAREVPVDKWIIIKRAHTLTIQPFVSECDNFQHTNTDTDTQVPTGYAKTNKNAFWQVQSPSWSII